MRSPVLSHDGCADNLNHEERPMPDTNVLSSIRSRVSQTEWQARLDCAAVYRLLAHFNMIDLVLNHVTLRVPGEGRHGGDRILINPFGWMYEEITASSLITIDLDGNELINPHPDIKVNYAGYVIHSAIHGARHDVGCVIHTHTRAGMAVSAMKCGFLPMTQTAIHCMPVAYHDYEGLSVDTDERARLVSHLGGADYLVLRNHGLLTCDATAPGAFTKMYWFEAACQAQVDAMAAGAQVQMVREDIVTRSIERRARVSAGYQPGQLEWPAMLRLLDRRDPSWRD
jgi:ribulose-5-phosphate 4-epimerase/fuculose-1-phosphate aldolase